MACSVKNVFSVSGSYEAIHKCSSNGSFSLGPPILSLQSTNSKDFFGKSLEVSDQKGLSHWSVKSPPKFSINAQSSICISKAMRWWEKTLKPNMIEINSAQELADSLVKAGDRLVIIDFYSPGCGGCKALHPKICQLAESNPDAIFLKVNYEELKAMCYSLHIHVLPFFRFYRGSEGKLCSFSCTNATIKKFKDALAKYGTDNYSLGGPAKGLDDSELLALASIGQLSTNYGKERTRKDNIEDFILGLGKDESKLGVHESTAMVMA